MHTKANRRSFKAPPRRGINPIPFMSRKRGRRKSGVLALHFVYGKNVPSAFPSLALIGSEKESNDLCAGATIVRPK